MVSVPLAAMLGTISDTAFTLSVAPTPTSSPLPTCDEDGQGYRRCIRPGLPRIIEQHWAALTLHITASQACPRDVLARYSGRHAEYFEPPNRNVHYRASGMARTRRKARSRGLLMAHRLLPP